MTPDSSTHPHDDLAVYALDALEPEEQAVIDAHLAGCAACRAELATYRDTLGHMTVAEEPPDQVWEGIARQISPTAVEPEPVPVRSDPAVVHIEDRRRPGPPSRPSRPRWLLPAAAAVAAVVGAGALIAGLGGDSGTPTVAEAAADAAVDPDSTMVSLEAPSGVRVARVVVTADDDYVVFDDLPELDPDETYQLWGTDEPSPVSLGLLGDATEGAVRLNLPEGTTAFALSREPAGGSAQPTEIVATPA
jgi:anti-sigma factor RsiW